MLSDAKMPSLKDKIESKAVAVEVKTAKPKKAVKKVLGAVKKKK